ncbi:MAG: hypothetical protein BJ554DRAFT_4080, partial [Olpidium bornovanus]
MLTSPSPKVRGEKKKKEEEEERKKKTPQPRAPPCTRSTLLPGPFPARAPFFRRLSLSVSRADARALSAVRPYLALFRCRWNPARGVFGDATASLWCPPFPSFSAFLPSPQLDEVAVLAREARLQSSTPGIGDPPGLVLKTPPPKGYVTAGSEHDSYPKELPRAPPPQQPQQHQRHYQQARVLELQRSSFAGAGSRLDTAANPSCGQRQHQQQHRQQPPGRTHDDGNATTTTDEEDSVIRCICGFDHDDGFTIQCERCYVWQHGQCVGVAVESVPNVYLCERCLPRPLDVKKAFELQRRKKREDADLPGDDEKDAEEDRDAGPHAKNHEAKPLPDAHHAKAGESHADDNHSARKARASPPSPKRKPLSKVQNGFRKSSAACGPAHLSPAKTPGPAESDAAGRRSGAAASSSFGPPGASRSKKPQQQHGMHQRRPSGPQTLRDSNADVADAAYAEDVDLDDDDSMAYQL